MRKYAWLILWFTGLVQYVHAQYLIKGRVTDSITGKPLTGVAIYIPAQNKGTVSDSAGYYQISSRYDTLTITATAMGYRDYVKYLRLTKKLTELPIKMREQVFNLSEVLISTPYARLQKDNVVKVSVRLLSDMQKRGITGLSEGLGQIPGVRLLNGSTPFAKPVIRGLTGNRILIYNNNIRYENYQFGAKHGMDLSGEGIRSVEVIKGPASLLYGSDALGGILYLVPEKFAPSNRFYGGINTYYAVNNQKFHWSAFWKHSGNRWKYILRYTRNKASDYQVPGGKFVLNSRYENTDIKVAAGYAHRMHNMEIRYNYHRALNGIYKTVSDTMSSGFLSPYQYTDLHMISAQDKWGRGKSYWDFKAGYSRFVRALIRHQTPFIQMHLHSLSVDVKRHLDRKNMHWIVGTQLGRKQNINYGRHYLLPNATEHSGGLFVTLQAKQPHDWIFQGGLRGDINKIDTHVDTEHPVALHKNLFSVTGSVGMKKSWYDRIFLRLNGAKGFRAPNLAELTSAGPHAGRIEKGNPNLKNEENYQIDMNWEWKSDHMEIYSDFYYNSIKNYIFLKPTGRMQGNYPVYKYDQTHAYLYGNETALHFHPHPWDFVHLEATYETSRGFNKRGVSLPLMPPDKWSLHLRISINRKKPETRPHWNLGLKNEFYDAYVRHSSDEPDYPSYSLWHAYVNMQIINGSFQWFVYLNLRNLTNVYYIPPLSAYREQNIPAPGRYITLGLSCGF